MPESKRRKPKPPNPNRAVPRKKLDLKPLEIHRAGQPPTNVNRDPAVEMEEPFEIPDLPEEASYEQVLVALSKLDPLEQEVMIAARLAAMPSQRDGGLPVAIPRMVRGAWAHQFRQLGLVCIPELATHELIAPDAGGTMRNHTASTLRRIGQDDLWKVAREENPELAKLVDDAKTPEQKRAAMQKLVERMPIQQRLALQKLQQHHPSELEPK